MKTNLYRVSLILVLMGVNSVADTPPIPPEQRKQVKILYLLQPHSIITDSGVVGLPVGTAVEEIEKGLYLAKGHKVKINESLLTTNPAAVVALLSVAVPVTTPKPTPAPKPVFAPKAMPRTVLPPMGTTSGLQIGTLGGSGPLGGNKQVYKTPVQERRYQNGRRIIENK
jgi:hypothetical protein